MGKLMGCDGRCFPNKTDKVYSDCESCGGRNPDYPFQGDDYAYCDMTVCDDVGVSDIVEVKICKDRS